MSIEELKQLQAKIIAKNRKWNIIGTILFFSIELITLIIFLNSNTILQIIIMTMIFEMIIVVVIVLIGKNRVNGKDIKTFYKEFKNVFVKRMLETRFSNLVYNYQNGFSEEYIQKMGMINTADSFDSNDYISGTYKSINFEQSDMHIQEEHETTDDDGHTTTYWVTIFLGRLMKFDFNKNFKADVQIASNGFEASRLPYYKKFTKVKMEDVEFNKMFKTYAESEHDAFYILTPHFMEKLKDIKKKLNCGVMFCFIDSKLYIAINNNKDSFEYNVLKPINEKVVEENMSKDIDLITNFVDELNLDNNLFRGEV